MYEAKVVLCVVVPPHGDPTMGQEPGKEALDFLAAAITPQRSPVLRLRLLAVSAVRRNQFGAVAFEEHSVQRIAIVGAIRQKTSRRNARMSGRKRRFNQRRFVRGSACHVDGERKTASVCNCHDLAAPTRYFFPALGFADSRPLFSLARRSRQRRIRRGRDRLGR